MYYGGGWSKMLESKPQGGTSVLVVKFCWHRKSCIHS